MAITANFGTSLDKDQVIAEIQRISEKQPELTPRPKLVLEKALKEGNLALVQDNDELIGWALVEPLTKNISEIGLVFIKPEFRSPAVFDLLMKLVSKRPEKMLLATYDKSLIRYVQKAWKAEQLSLAKVIWLTRGKFVLKRMDKLSRGAIKRKIAKSKPLYAIVGER